jgi:hypothetical protein
MHKLILSAAAAALIAGGTVAQAAPVRTAAPVENSENLGGALGGAHALLGLLGAIALGLVIWQIADDDDEPASR